MRRRRVVSSLRADLARLHRDLADRAERLPDVRAAAMARDLADRLDGDGPVVVPGYLVGARFGVADVVIEVDGRVSLAVDEPLRVVVVDR